MRICQRLRLAPMTSIGLLIAAPFVWGAETPTLSQTQKEQIDALFEDYTKTGSPGVALGVIQGGKFAYKKGYGLADLEHDVPITPSTVFYMASVSKHVVTFCILLLEEEGKLSLDDEIQKHLPDFPRYDDPLTIRHFIHHTSGVRDNLTLWSLAGNSTLDHIEDEAIYELIKRQKTLNFKPGERYLYSNSCYFMLARIVKEASGMSIRDFAEKKMFGPLGMKNTRFHDDVFELIKNRAFSYEPSDNGYRNLIMRFDLVGSGGLYSNIEDMLLWDRNFSNNKLGKGGQAIIEKMHKEGVLNSGESADYAFGLVNSTYRGLRTVSHGGALAGYRTFYLRFPDDDCSIVVLGNVASFRSSRSAHAVAKIVLEGRLSPEEAPDATPSDQAAPKVVQLPKESLEKFTGVYVIAAGMEVTVSIRDASLHLHQGWNDVEYPVAASGPDSFFIAPQGAVKFKFSDVENDEAQTLTVDQRGHIMKALRRVEVTAADLGEFVGTYYCPELDTRYVIEVEAGELTVRIGYQPRLKLSPAGRDRFETERATAQFTRDGDKVTGFVVDAGRVQNLRFDRVGGK